MTADIEAALDKRKTKKIAEREKERAERQELFEKLFDTYSDEIFGNELSMGKSMGLMGMVGMVAALARQAAEP